MTNRNGARDQDGNNNGDALASRTKKEETDNTATMLIRGRYALAAGVLLTWNPRVATGVDGEILKMTAVVDVNQHFWSSTCPIRLWNKNNSVGLACLGALFYALVRRNTRWRCTKNARKIVRKSRWKLSDRVQKR